MLSGILCGIFFLSGATALVFETVWFRQAGLAFGNGVWASSIVLASFMAGIALGNGLAARFATRIVFPVRFYALVEVIIGLTGTALVFILPEITTALVPVMRPILEQPWILNPLRFGCGFFLMLLPATAMGATLPLLVKGLLARDASFGSALGRLYGWNTLGAVFGAVVGEAVLLDWVGVRGTAFVALAGNLIAALAAVLIGKQFVSSAVSATSTQITSRAWRCLIGTGLSGAVLLALEVVWLRFLRLFSESNALVFSLMLAVVLAGIGLGGLLAGAWLRRHPTSYRHASIVALACGALTAAVYAGFQFALEPLDTYYFTVLWRAWWLMFPVSLLSGVLFTLVGAALNEEIAPETRAAGLLTLFNTVGAGLGALLAGFLLLPLLGTELSFFTLAASYGLVALLLSKIGSGGHESQGSSSRPLRYLPAALFALCVAFFPFGLMRSEYIEFSSRGSDPKYQLEIVGMNEGRTETIVYVRASLFGEPIAYRLLTDGFRMSGSAIQGRRYMKLFVYWAVALQPDPKSALLISYGVGSTAKALTDTRSLEQIDIVDISRDVLKMNEIVFPDPAQHPLNDPRVQVHIEDGRYFLQTTEQSYDLITAEPPPPKHAGVVNLYSQEYFQLIYDRLNKGGINTYWLPVSHLSPNEAKAIIRGYCNVFEDCSLWIGWGQSWMLVGSRDASWSRSESDFARQWQDPVVGPELRTLGFERPEQIGAQFLADAKFLARYTRGVEPLVDNFPKRLTNEPKRSQQDGASFNQLMAAKPARARFSKSSFIAKVWPEKLREDSLAYFEWSLRGKPTRQFYRKGLWPHLKRVHRTLVDTSLRLPTLWELGTNDDELEIVERLAARGELDAIQHLHRGWGALADRDFARADQYFERAQALEVRHRALGHYRLYAMCMAGRHEEAEAFARETLPKLFEASQPAVCDSLATRLAS